MAYMPWQVVISVYETVSISYAYLHSYGLKIYVWKLWLSKLYKLSYIGLTFRPDRTFSGQWKQHKALI